ncbi:MAG: UDP-3-O-[3-hydroxymyristoyl] N-acetylglucosamine deacetylase [Deltaproteobacteria bacterium RBG_13_61_14]|nr:MAG: UDP-3-O-[3-hydroxymyristoyl] N-acetylglucosamine deacetylase [Deltaproteobacteria bacterium RBG_13_61_14]
MLQTTLSIPVSCQGTGLHTGESASLKIWPAPPDHGIVFVRTDLKRPELIPARCENIRSTQNASTLGVNGTRVGTVEHLLAAFYGLQIDNAVVEVQGPEIPIMDGSAEPFVQMLYAAGAERQSRPRRKLVVTRPVRVEENGKWAELMPSDRLRIRFTISFDHPAIKDQTLEVEFSNGNFREEISRARTFGFLHEVETLKAHGLAKGGSLENAVILDAQGVINPEGLRFPDEFVRHKILDTLGDLMLIGLPIQGAYRGYKSGHSLNLKLVQALLADHAAYDIL